MSRPRNDDDQDYPRGRSRDPWGDRDAAIRGNTGEDDVPARMPPRRDGPSPDRDRPRLRDEDREPPRRTPSRGLDEDRRRRERDREEDWRARDDEQRDRRRPRDDDDRFARRAPADDRLPRRPYDEDDRRPERRPPSRDDGNDRPRRAADPYAGRPRSADYGARPRSAPSRQLWEDESEMMPARGGSRSAARSRDRDYEDDRHGPPRRRSAQWDDEASRSWGRSDGFRRGATGFVPTVQTIYTEAVQVPLKGLDKLLGGRLTKHPWLRIVLVLSMVLAVFGPLGITGFIQFQQVKGLAYDGQHELLAIKDLLSATTKALPATAKLEDKARAVLTPAVLAQMQQHADTALADFQQLDQIISQRQGLLFVAGVTPFASTLDAVDRIAKVGIDVALIARQFAQTGASLAPIFSSSLFATTGPPIFNETTFGTLMGFVTQIKPQIDDAARQLNGLDITKLPLNQKQLAQFGQILPAIPSATKALDTLIANKDALHWVLGVDKPRLILLQTMDRGEMRPTGGFTGQFGTLAITGGRLGTISLSDVNTIDAQYYGGYNPYESGTIQYVPSEYQPWWPFVGFGLRDSNLSGDYPTSAKLAEFFYTHEGKYINGKPVLNSPVDGVINFSPLVIEHLLKPEILGPLQVACYNVTVTADNLEDELHAFQLGSTGGDAAYAKCQKATDTTQRKQFTSAMALQLENQLRSAPPDRLAKVLASFSTDLQNKQIQIYFNDEKTESFLRKNNIDGALRHDAGVDTTAVIHTNMGGNKGSVYLDLTQQEQITLDSAGNAQHTLTLVMDYKPIKNVYGYAGVITLRHYLRIYVPKGAHDISGSGFDQNQHNNPLCYNDANCSPKGAPVCTTPPNNINVSQPYPYYWPKGDASAFTVGSHNTRIDAIGGPTNVGNSDFPPMDMIGGLVVLPPFCKQTVIVKWTVPNAVHEGTYTYMAQNQSDVFQDLTVDITNGSKSVHDHVSPLLHNVQWKLDK